MKNFHGSLDIDSLFNVLSRVPVKILLGFRCVSEEWYNIISNNRSFIKVHLEETEPTLSGFIFQEKFRCSNEDIKTISYMNINSLDRHHNEQSTRSKSIIHHKMFSFLPEDVVVLSSCNGLLCCRSCCFLSSSTKTTLYVCNPTNKEWITLDCPDYNKHESIVLTFDPYKDPIDVSTNFHVVRVKQFEIETENEDEEDEDKVELSQYFTFELYSSTTKLWKKSNEICHYDHGSIKKQGIYIGNVLYWLTDADHILTFNLDKELSLVISTPIPSGEFKAIPEACIGEWKGILCYVMITENGLHVWYLEDYYEAKWELKFWKSLEDIERENPKFFCNLKNHVLRRAGLHQNPWMDPLSFKDGVLLMKVFVHVYFYDIEKNLMAEACKFQDLSTNSLPCPIVLPYSMSLVPL
ncbi:F-box protein At5g07610-like [Neltuma alba]|uniref:F-box protein At5g07610-like n=1 Tax=Neltuma alba TaxID=207710 RepID=UPI0010A2D5A6|nr:F-box protein At5g07610-like [Prosopis alba]